MLAAYLTAPVRARHDGSVDRRQHQETLPHEARPQHHVVDVLVIEARCAPGGAREVARTTRSPPARARTPRAAGTAPWPRQFPMHPPERTRCAEDAAAN